MPDGPADINNPFVNKDRDGAVRGAGRDAVGRSELHRARQLVAWFRSA